MEDSDGIIYIKKKYCCRPSEYFKLDSENCELNEKFEELFNNNENIVLHQGIYVEKNNFYQFFNSSIKLIRIYKSEYECAKFKVVNIIC
jgi:hypothetical protein